MKKHNNQFILVIDREFASGGKEIATILSEALDLPIYDHNIIDVLKRERMIINKGFRALDENPRNRLFSRTVRGFTNSNEHALAQMQFDFLKERAKAGESFIVMGHCANEVLKGEKGLVSMFISADMDFKLTRAIEVEGIAPSQAREVIDRKNKERKAYHNSHCATKWGDSRHYDLCVKSSFLGIQDTAAYILDFLKLKTHEDKL